MDRSTLNEILSFLEDFGTHRLMLSGGEPTLHPDFLGMVYLCQHRNFKVMLNTSGLAFADPYFLGRAVDNGLSFVNLSLKGVNGRDFMANTGVDGFWEQRSAVENMSKDKRLTLTINLTLNRYFMSNFDQALDLLREWGVNAVSVDLARPVDGPDPYGGGSIPTEEEAAEFVIDCISKLAGGDMNYIFRLDVPLCRFAKSNVADRIKQLNFMTNCFMRDGNVVVFDPIGQVVPCNILTGNVLGRIGKDFSTAREYDRFLRREDVAQKMKTLLTDDSEECSSCPLAHKCCRGCAAFKFHKALDAVVPAI